MIKDYNIKIYDGEESYIFICYCHQNSDVIYPIIELLSSYGYRVWLDDGLHPGDDWPEVIAQKLDKSAICIAFMSQEFSDSHNCRNELNFAVSSKKNLVTVMLHEFSMPLGMKLQLATSHIIKLRDYPNNESIVDSICQADGISACGNRKNQIKQQRIRPSAQPVRNEVNSEYALPIYDCETDYSRKVDQETVAMNRSEYIAILVDIQTGKVFRANSQQVRVGRSIEKNELSFPNNSSVSETHASITLASNCICVTDKDSRNGTYINGVKIPPNVPVAIEKPSLITFANESCFYVFNNAAVSILQEKKIAILQNVNTGEVKLINGNEILLGRSHPWEYGTLNDRKISRNHAKIFYDGSKYTLEDISRNGTVLNNKTVTPNKPIVLRNDDIIVMGDTTIKVIILDIKE